MVSLSLTVGRWNLSVDLVREAPEEPAEERTVTMTQLLALAEEEAREEVAFGFPIAVAIPDKAAGLTAPLEVD